MGAEARARLGCRKRRGLLASENVSPQRAAIILLRLEARDVLLMCLSNIFDAGCLGATMIK
ncbi:MAG: hypothetical protein EB832_02780 [Thaumarchaeota archaeon S14]|nr:MAG: hypothetical protein EB832_02780 [Thaumarchaeota archaeon S14]